MIRTLYLAGLLGVALLALACGGPWAAPAGDGPALQAAMGAPTDRATDDLLVLGGTLVRPGEPDISTGPWPELIGDYASRGDTLIVREREGVLEALIDGAYALTSTSRFTYRLSGAGPWNGQAVRFEVGEDGLGDVVWLDGRRFDRLRYGAEHGETFRIRPVRPVEELRRAALAATPPVEEDDFRAPELVDLATLDPSIRFDIRYATTNNFMGAVFYQEPRAFLQRPAAEALLRAHRRLALEGLGLLVFDAYRPWFVTWMFFHATPVEQRVFVANPAHGSRHNRGAAVDVTLYDLATGRPLPMPSGYDEFSPRAYPNYPGGTSEERYNRELLRRVMATEGFAVYHAEWWHFDFRDWRSYPILNLTFDELVEFSAVNHRHTTRAAAPGLGPDPDLDIPTKRCQETGDPLQGEAAEIAA
jgi:D-alanyl-D-alanine dipeptidase